MDELGLAVVGVVGAWGAMKTVVVKMLGAAGSCGRGAAFGWVRDYSCDREGAQETVGGGGEPGGVAWFECGEVLVWGVMAGGVELAEGCEEVVGQGFVEGE